ncbi:hypothetical protein [Chitinimonas koreensis]|uniref:hypothetical protein n=1 Tax=Chitinimonas koreensis TaxID=356302 RepID=UPI0003F7B315|nr:hypothetical protein [Chitinimonas koreensis]QNM96930.1 hypothetical protein H9L41_00845 [Chitinimonas koreensis]
MKRENRIAVAALCIAAGCLAWTLWPAAPASQPAVARPEPAVRTEPPRPPEPVALIAAELPPAPTAAGPAIDQSAPAVLSLSAARERGDERAPPLARSDEGREPASAAELADPARYRQYAERQQRKLYRAYVAAADRMLPQLDADIARARSEGRIDPAEIAQAEEKRRRIAAMQAEAAARLGEQTAVDNQEQLYR